jgi:hypothetical protein
MTDSKFELPVVVLVSIIWFFSSWYVIEVFIG